MRHSEDHVGTFPTATGGIARLAWLRAREAGLEVELLLRKAGLTQQQMEDRSTRVNVRDQIKFLELASQALKDDLLGFHLGQNFDLREVGLLYYVLASSERLDETLQRASRYSKIANEGISLSYRDGKDVEIALDYVGVARHSDRHQIEFWMAALVRIIRQLTGRRLPASRVRLMHRRSGDIAEFNAFFGGDTAFAAAADEIAFPSSVREMTVVSADPYLNELLVKYCEEAIAGRTTKRSPFGLEVENAIALLLPHGKARVSEVARKLGVSQRTLARRLSAEGLTFAGVLQNLRFDLANRHLRDEGLPISRISWLLGYQDISAFTHAFKRWTGTAPRAARRASR